MPPDRSPLQLPDVRVLDLDANHIKAAYENMLLTVWRRETTLAAYQRIAPLVHQIARDYPAGVGVLQIVEESAAPPDADTKSEFLKTFSLMKDHVKHYSVVYEGTGFRAAGFRAVTLAAYTYARPKFPHQVFTSLAEAARWHAEQQKLLGRTTTETNLLSVARALRSQAQNAASPHS